jgi:prepilin-type N-terminal cleavage/methylation domain-containing protein
MNIRMPIAEERMPTQSRGHGTQAHAASGRRGFTMIELMITMAIIVILSALVAVAMGGAEEAARVSHTRAVVARLHTLIMDRYESYRWRRLPIQSTSMTSSVNGGDNPALAAKSRCNAIRELMRKELPDRWTDIDSGNTSDLLPATAASTAYYNAYIAAITRSEAAGQSTLDLTYQGADCLYLIVTMGLEENDVMENFSQTDIGPDPKNPNSGLFCFLDAWGNPIQFLRWAPGFSSPMQPISYSTQGPAYDVFPTDPDQTDPTGYYGITQANGGVFPYTGAAGTKPVSYALYPLIYSAGADGYYDVLADWTQLTTNPASQIAPLRYSQQPAAPQLAISNNPFVYYTDPATNTPVMIGTQMIFGPTASNTAGRPAAFPQNTTGSSGSVDNVHNQEIGSH